MSKKREVVKMKYGGKCAYSGLPLDEKWQIDHICPKCYYLAWHGPDSNPDDISNLVPALRIVNHYKRALDLEGWRKYLLTLHTRIAKLPKNPWTAKGIGRKQYLLEVAAAFGITPEKPFNGVFYFETLTPTNNNTNKGE